MAKVDERLKVEALRRKGLSLREIANKVPVSKSSISGWCRGIELSDKSKKRLFRLWQEGGHKGRILGASTNHRRKIEKIEKYVKDGKNNVGILSSRELLLVGAAIYWGEGSKKSQMAIINSDASMIIFMYNWFRQAIGVRKSDFILRVFVNSLHKSRDAVIKKYWAKLLDTPLDQFRKTIFIKRPNTKKYSNHDTYYGLLSIRARNSSEIKYRILGLIEGLKYSKF